MSSRRPSKEWTIAQLRKRIASDQAALDAQLKSEERAPEEDIVETLADENLQTEASICDPEPAPEPGLATPVPENLIDIDALEEVAQSQCSDQLSGMSTSVSQRSGKRKRESLPTAGQKGAPSRRGRNNMRFADHFFMTADHVAESMTKDMMIEIVKKTWYDDVGDGDIHVRCVVVHEVHADGSKHFHAVSLADHFRAPKSIIQRAREADLEVRGYKVPPSMRFRDVHAGGKGRGHQRKVSEKIAGTGVMWHLNVLFHHEYVDSDPEVKKGTRHAHEYKSAWPPRPQPLDHFTI